MNYSKALIRFIPFLLLPLVFFIFDNYSGSVKRGMVFYVIPTAILLIIALFFFLKSLKQKQILQNGIMGIAKVISVEDTGIQINFKPQLHIKLSVSIPGKAPYETVHTDSVDYWNMIYKFI